MYVIFPAEEVVDLTLGIVSPNNPAYPCLVPSVPSWNQRSAEQLDGPYQQYLHANTGSGGHWFHNKDDPSQDQVKQELPSSGKKEKKKKQQRKTTPTKSRTQQGGKMATGGDVTLRELAHPALNEALKGHNSVTFKLVRTVSDFTQQLAQIYEQHAEEMQLLVSNFRKKNADLRKERPACPSSLFHTWETMLQEVEIDSQAHSDIASILGRQVARPLIEKSFHRKIQSRKVFTHRESYETILVKTEEKLAKCRQDYKNSYLVYLSSPTTASLANYFDTHNAYVQQLHATNGMLEQYNTETLPQLLQELEEVYSDLCLTLTESVLQGAEVISNRASEQYRRYEGLSSQCKAVLPSTDLAHFVRSVTVPQHHPHRPSLRHNFLAPQPPPPPEVPDGPGGGAPHDNTPNLQDLNPPPPLKNELVVDRLVNLQPRLRFEALKKEALELDTQIKQLQDSLDTLLRIQQRSLESNLYNKVNELQEDISMKRFDLRVAQIHLSAVKSQKELFASKVESTSESGRERKMSSSSTGSMKNKWLKAFKSLKTGSGTTPTNGAPREADKKNQMYHAVSTIMSMRKNGKETGALQAANADPSVHAFQEYTYKKITPCDVCSQVLRGHARQGLKCRVCKMNVHVDCQGQVGRCQPKSRLLRRQKSTSEIETRIPDALPDEESPVGATSVPTDSHRRRRLFAGMKSLSMLGARGGSPSSARSISLPESRSPGFASGTRPFGQPLCLTETNENSSVHDIDTKTNRYSK